MNDSVVKIILTNNRMKRSFFFYLNFSDFKESFSFITEHQASLAPPDDCP